MKKKNMLLIGIGTVMAAAAFFFLKKRNDKEEKPSKKAPQLDVQNPGEQSEFTTAASESEIG
ncbi:MAG: LPXTG cell wall anchor domain-containing protein [Flavisolibacter sp.]